MVRVRTTFSNLHSRSDANRRVVECEPLLELLGLLIDRRSAPDVELLWITVDLLGYCKPRLFHLRDGLLDAIEGSRLLDHRSVLQQEPLT